MFRNDADILHCSHAVAVMHTLDGAAKFASPTSPRFVFKEPGSGFNKALAANDIAHEAMAALALAKTGKDVSVDFFAKTAIFHLRMRADQPLGPGEQEIAFRQRRSLEESPVKVDLHSESFEVGDSQVHSTFAVQG